LKRKNQKNQKKLKRKSSKKNDDIPSDFSSLFSQIFRFSEVTVGNRYKALKRQRGLEPVPAITF
jgi:hypothetical protein